MSVLTRAFFDAKFKNSQRILRVFPDRNFRRFAAPGWCTDESAFWSDHCRLTIQTSSSSFHPPVFLIVSCLRNSAP